VRFQYGSYTHEPFECLVSFFGQARQYNARGRAQTLRKRMVVEGEIIGASTAAIDARVAAIKAAYSIEGGTARLLDASGNATAYVLESNAISGVRIVEGPTFFQQEGKAHFVTGLPFQIVLEGDYANSDGDTLVSYSENITKIGSGGPRRVMVECDQGLPIEQVVSQNTPIVIVQAGEAVGYLARPNANPPLFAPDQPDGEQINVGTPRKDGINWVDWPIRWAYRTTLASNVNIPLPLLR
jgi:hypothetical protein